MPKVNTHLHIALKLSEAMTIKDLDSFLLGNAYPDCWTTSSEKSLCYGEREFLSLGYSPLSADKPLLFSFLKRRNTNTA